MTEVAEAPKKSVKMPTQTAQAANMDLLSAVSMRVSVEVGSASIRLADLLDLNEGSIVELDRQANDLLDIFANGTLIAKGEIVTVEGRYGIRVVTVVAPEHGAHGLERRA